MFFRKNRLFEKVPPSRPFCLRHWGGGGLEKTSTKKMVAKSKKGRHFFIIVAQKCLTIKKGRQNGVGIKFEPLS